MFWSGIVTNGVVGQLDSPVSLGSWNDSYLPAIRVITKNIYIYISSKQLTRSENTGRYYSQCLFKQKPQDRLHALKIFRLMQQDFL